MEKLLFDSDWEVQDRLAGFGSPAEAWQPVRLPDDVSIRKPRSASHPTGPGGGYAWSGAVTYRKKFTLPSEWRGQSLQLEFEGVYCNAEVSLNHQLLALHPYGYTGFLVDLDPALNFNGENLLSVVANNSPQPNSRWYSGTGIYRHVWLRVGGSSYFRPWGVFVTTPRIEPGLAEVQVQTEIAVEIPGAVLSSTILDADGQAVAQVVTPLEGQTHRQTLRVMSPRLWSLEEPALYTLISELRIEGDRVDREVTVFGIRSLSLDARAGLRLNGAPLKLKGGCIHHDHGPLGAASYDRAEERKVEILKASGFNAIRCAHNPPAPALLDACDRLGMLVIDESFDCWRMGKNPADYHLFFEDWWQRDTEAMVRRDRNHPSVLAWSIGNEVPERGGVSEGYAWARRQAGLIRALDPTRPVSSALPFLFEAVFAVPGLQDQVQSDPQSATDPKNFLPQDPESDRWGRLTAEFCQALDLVGYNYLYSRYAYDGEHFPGRVMAGTETFPLDAYAFWQETERLPSVIGDFVWTAWDYLGESGIGRVTYGSAGEFSAPYPYHLANCGDLDICGFKRPQSYFRDILWGLRGTPYIAARDPRTFDQAVHYNRWGWEPVLESWSFPGQAGRPTRVDVYSAAEEVELWINGVSQGRQPAGEKGQNQAHFEVLYQPGTVEAASYSAGQETGRAYLVTSGEPAALRLSVDRPSLRAVYGDLAYLTVEIVDAAGARVTYAEPEVIFEVSGVGECIAVGTANPESEEPYVGHQRRAWQGRLLAVVRASGTPGTIRVRAHSGEWAAETEIKVN